MASPSAAIVWPVIALTQSEATWSASDLLKFTIATLMAAAVMSGPVMWRAAMPAMLTIRPHTDRRRY